MRFKNEYYFLSNMYPHPVTIDGVTYRCAEAAFQAAKCLDPDEKALFADLDGYAAKHLGRKIKLRPDWNQIRVSVMKSVIDAKFSDADLAEKLAATAPVPITEDNTWHDTFWGVCSGRGQNHLGHILEQKRTEILSEK